MNEVTIILTCFAAIAYGPWLLDCLVREIRIRRAHYA
jgi:hypothetical protein